MLPTLLLNLALLAAAMLLLWLLSLWLRNVSIVDVFWGLGFILVIWLSGLWNENFAPRLLLVGALTTIWGLRLALHVLWRNHGHAEDRRYAAMREHHGQRFWWVSLFTVFLLQALLLWIVSWPLQATAVVTKRELLSTSAELLGMALWCFGFAFEVVGDWQLLRFKADERNKGRVLDQGLWRWTRHPNYFGECCLWWGIFLLTWNTEVWWTIVSPLLLTFLLLKISGVSLLESDMAERRPEYRDYQRRTSKFVPWFPQE